MDRERGLVEPVYRVGPETLGFVVEAALGLGSADPGWIDRSSGHLWHVLDHPSPFLLADVALPRNCNFGGALPAPDVGPKGENSTNTSGRPEKLPETATAVTSHNITS